MDKSNIKVETSCVCGSKFVAESFDTNSAIQLWQAWQKIHYRCTLNDQQWRKPLDAPEVFRLKIGGNGK